VGNSEALALRGKRHGRF